MLDISPLIMVVTFVVFLIMLVMLNQRLYRPLLKFMDDRDAALRRERAEAESLTGNTADLEAEAAAIIDAAKSEAAQARQKTLDALQAEHEAAMASRQNEWMQQYETFVGALQKEKEALRAKLLSEMPLLKEALKAKFAQL
jgi:F-type H+-transporting ATPase subunit b